MRSNERFFRRAFNIGFYPNFLFLMGFFPFLATAILLVDGNTCGINNAVTFLHVRNHSLSQVKHRQNIHIKGLKKLLRRNIANTFLRILNPGIIDQNINGFKFLKRLLNHFLDFILIL